MSNNKEQIKSILEFKVYPNTKSRHLYYLVRVYRTFKELRSLTKLSKETLAFVDSYIRSGNKNECGTINFCIKRLGMELITHESTHAAIRYANRVKRNFVLDLGEGVGFQARNDIRWDKEEYICLLVGRIASQINSKFYKNGVYK